MSGQLLKKTLESIRPVDQAMIDRAQAKWDTVAKPLRSLGKLEKATSQMAGIYGRELYELDKKALIIMCADNGIVEEGVTQSGQYVTAVVAENFLDTKSCAAIMCRETGTTIRPIDIGMVTDTPRVEKHKILYGTRNFIHEPAMTREEAIAAIEVGIDIARDMKEKGYQILATGEMGIGNTTTSSAIVSAMLEVPVEEVTGRGAGLTSAGLEKKIAVIKRGLALHKPDKEDPIDVLSKVGGLDIAGLAGVFLGCAAYGLTGVIDGFISAAAALIAVRLCPEAAGYILPSHVSKEPAGRMVLDAMGMDPFLICDMCLGEGTGAIALFPLLDMALAIYRDMVEFEDSGFETYVPLS